MNDQQEPCPCGSGAALRNCCLPFIKGQSNAPSAEALMRSRYVAYCLNEEQYLLGSWYVSTRPAFSLMMKLGSIWMPSSNQDNWG